VRYSDRKYISSSPLIFPFTTLFRSPPAAGGRAAAGGIGGQATPSPPAPAARACHVHDPPGGVPRLLRLDDRKVPGQRRRGTPPRSEEHTSELQSRENLVCRLLL